MFDLPIEQLYPLKEMLVERGLADKEKKE
jgi:hypothetical protein